MAPPHAISRRRGLRAGRPVRRAQAGRAQAGRAGYSLLETLVALAIMATAAAIIVPRAAGTMDQVVAHSVFFDFQRQVSDLRRRAFRAQTPVVLVAPPPGGPDTAAAGAPGDGSSGDGSSGDGSSGAGVATVTLALRSGWTYALSQPLKVDAGGMCDTVSADLIRDGHVRVHLAGSDRACHFVRAW